MRSLAVVLAALAVAGCGGVPSSDDGGEGGSGGGTGGTGSGTLASPFVIPSLPFVDLRDTRAGALNRIGTYTGCSATDESGPEFLYRLNLTQTTALRAVVVSVGGADVDVHVLDGTAAASGCVARNDKQVTATLAPGTWYLSLDTYVSGGAALAGEYLLVVLAD